MPPSVAGRTSISALTGPVAWGYIADETAAKAAPPQNDADLGLNNLQLSSNLLLRPRRAAP
jgi:hypothetical protein